MVEEDEYRSTYRNINQRRCIFEKAILTRRCSCTRSARFYLADREGITCKSAPDRDRCDRFIALLRENARFALRLTALDGELPHAKEIKVQNGGLIGLQSILHPQLGGDKVIDVAALTALGEQTFGTLEQIPYQQIVKSIAEFEGRPRRHSKH
jgi:hypothetical protein